MGRPLKIQKYSTGSSISGGAVAIDQAYPPFTAPSSMDLNTAVSPGPTYPTWLGVVGGKRGGSVSSTYPVIECQVNITLATGAANGVHNGIILRQKGSHKYLVQDLTTVQDEAIRPNNAYIITSLGTTDWQALGAPAGAIVGTVFTATDTGSGLTTTGQVNLVGVCVLDGTDTTPGSGQMVITYTYGDSTATPISKLTNKFMLNWNNFQNADGTTLTSYTNSSDAVGEVIYSGEDELAANFFTDEGTVAKSGSETDATLNLGIVENYTS